MPAAFPAVDIDPTDRNEGNAAHWIAQQIFNGTVEQTTGVAPNTSIVGAKAFNGVVITAEMLDHVGEYLAALDCGEMETVTSFGTDSWRVNARCDHWKFRADLSTLTVDDFKYGWGLVEPEGNWTLIAHAIGLCIFNQIQPATIILRIHQPRPHHPDGKMREWRLTYAELMGYYERIAATMANPSDELRTGIEWCRKCHALATCPAARAARMNAVDATAMTFTDELPDDALAYELDLIRTAKATLDAQLDALEELTAHRLRNGKVIDNYALEAQFANTRWKTGLTPEALTLASGIDCMKPGTITPAEAKRRGMPEHVVKSLTERPQTGVKLVRVSAAKRAERLLRK